MSTFKRLHPPKHIVDQVNEVLAQNNRILAMNEALLRAILSTPIVMNTDLNHEAIMRSLREKHL